MLGFPGGAYMPPFQQNNIGGMGSIPPSPIGNIANIGGYGYNTGARWGGFMNSPYYTNNFNYYNPYAIQQQQKAIEAAQKEMRRKQSDMMKHISRVVHKALGDITDEAELEEHLKQYDYETVDTEVNEICEQLRLRRRLINLKPVQPNYAWLSYAHKIQDSYKSKYPDDMSLAEFLDKAGELYRDSLIELNERKQRDGKLKYNSDKFKSIVDLHRSSSSYFNSALSGKSVDIGDLEIQLPNNGERPKMVLNMPSKLSEYAERRQKFIQACLNSGKRV